MATFSTVEMVAIVVNGDQQEILVTIGGCGGVESESEV